VVEECEHVLVVAHDARIGLPSRDGAEPAVGGHRPHPIDHVSSDRQDRSGARLTWLEMRILFALTMLTVAVACGSMLSAGASGADPCTPGLEGDDRISGGPGADCIDGGPGNDRISGLAGGDTLEGADGNDILSGGAGADALAGGPGADRLSGGAGADRLSDVAGTYATVGAASKRNRVAAGAGRDRVDTANGRRDMVHCGSGRDLAVADREDTLAGCEDKRFRRSPLPEAAPPSGGRQQMFMVRFRALEEVASQGEQFSIAVTGPAGCGQIVTSSLGIRYRAGETVRYRLNPFGPNGRSAKRWCRGLYRGTVDFVRDATPAVRVGRFSFRVR